MGLCRLGHNDPSQKSGMACAGLVQPGSSGLFRATTNDEHN
jgi:hypothetical protein